MHPNGWVDHLHIGKRSFLCPRLTRQFKVLYYYDQFWKIFTPESFLLI